MELQQYLMLVRRWWWLLLLSAFVAGSVAYITRSNQAPTYRTNVTVSIGSFIRSPNPDVGEINTGRNLVVTYQQLVETFDVLQATVENLNLQMSPDALADVITTSTVLNTSLLTITVTYTDPILAADIANELAQQLIRLGPSGLSEDERTRIDFLNEQISILTTELDSLRGQLVDVTTDLSAEDDADEIARLEERRASLINQINATTSNIAQFSNNVSSLQERTNTVEIVENARVATRVNAGSTLSAAALGAMVGASLAFGLVLLLEYLNNTFRNSDEVTQFLRVPVLGVVSRFGKKSDDYTEKLITKLPLLSRTPEEYRTVRTNLLFSAEDKRRVYIVTSAAPSEGKSVTTANIAASMALSGLRVLLIDADLRRPKQHSIFNVANEVGLTTLLAGSGKDGQMDDIAYLREQWSQCMQETTVPGLKLITSGFIPTNPTEILGSTLMTRWVRAFRESKQFDVIMFDTPPTLAMSDATVLAVSVDANVVMVVEANKTRRPAAEKAKERFEQVGAKIVGVILNNANMREESYYGYGYSGYYYQQPEQPARK